MKYVEYVKMGIEHADDVMRNLNYYVENSFAAYADEKLPILFFGKLIEVTEGYPAFVIKSGDAVVGFCFLKAYNSFPTFKNTAEISYFIDKGYVGKGLAKMVLNKVMPCCPAARHYYYSGQRIF